MTKSELALVEELKTKASFYRTEKVEPDVPIPTSYSEEKLSKGYRFLHFQSYGECGRVEKACSSSIYHGEGWEKTTSQGAIPLFSSRLLALKALRYEIELECMKKLRAVDKQIEEEELKMKG